MSDSLSNKELVAVGHHLAKALSSDMPIIDIAKIVSRLAERLDCTAAALHATQAQRDQLAVENAALKNPDNWLSQSDYGYEASEVAASNGASEGDALRAGMMGIINRIKTPATDSFLAEVRAQGAEGFIDFCGEENSVFVESKAYYRSLSDAVAEFAAQLRQDGAA
ncbi:hypothetical protein [Leclercia adecarboxylata]|uniref:hypothetical protein n=1 Tax=Leclercia adecarboxylata TaxID=83655 RepID=UPI00068B57C2|nr:hypothetical protein [Leclercia adecarboxylata]